MEQGYELRLTDIRKAVLEQSQNNELYIPLHGKHTTNPEEEPFDLAEKIQSFFVFDDASQHDPKVMLLMGGTGSGKSVFSQQLHHQLWRVYKSGDPIPLWIPLPELQNPFEGAIEEVLTKYGFDERQIAEIKEKEKFIFIADGYDELHQFQNCYVTNKWEKWNAKALITCRSQALYYQQDPDKYFVPFNGEKRLPLLLRKLYVAAFSEEQIGSYVRQYQQLNTEHKISEEDFIKVAGLTELIKTPFLLHLAVEALPDILASQVDDEKMTQAKLYDVFIERWFTRQVRKLETGGQLIDAEQITKQRFWDYCKRLAEQMHAREVTLIPYTQQKVGGRLFGKEEKKNSWESFFGEDTEVVRSACPLRRMGDHHYGFIHASFVEYFATRAMYEEIQEKELSKEIKDEIEAIETMSGDRDTEKPQGGIHYRVFAKERNGIRHLADRIEMNEGFKRKMIKLVEDSKRSERYAVGAANAISALVRAGETFNGVDFRGIKIAGADIGGGFFDHADLSGADLSDTHMNQVWMSGANLAGSQLNNVTFGEYAWFKHERGIKAIDYSDDIQRLITVCSDGIIIWDPETGVQVNRVPSYRKNSIWARFCSNGERLISCGDDAELSIWDVETGSLLSEFPKQDGISYHFMPNDEIVISCGPNKTVVWELSTGNQIAGVTHERSLVSHYSNAFTPNGNKLAVVNYNEIQIWNMSTGEDLGILKVNEQMVSCIEFSPDGERLISGSWDKTIRVWELESKLTLMVLSGHEDLISTINISLDGKYVVSGSHDKTIRVWDLSTKKEISILRGHEGRIEGVRFCQDGKRVVSMGGVVSNGGMNDFTVRVWDIVGGNQRTRFRGHTGDVLSVEYNLDGEQVVSGSRDRTARVWETVSGEERAVLAGHERPVKSASFNSKGDLIVTGCDDDRDDDDTIRIWDALACKEVFVLKGQSGVFKVSFSSDSQHVWYGGFGSVKKWDFVNAEVLSIINSDQVLIAEGEVRCLAFSSSEQWVAAAISEGYDQEHTGVIKIWNTQNGSLQVVLNEYQGRIECLAFSPDEKLIASGAHDRIVRVWEALSGHCKFKMRGHDYAISRVMFSPNGKRIISGSQDRTIRVWNVDNGECVSVLKLYAKVLTFALNTSQWLVVGFEDGVIGCWQNIGDESDYRWQLRWSTDIDSRVLFVEDANISDVIGVSAQNLALLKQRGAIGMGEETQHKISPRISFSRVSEVEVEVEPVPVPEPVTNSVIAQCAGSPIYHQPDVVASRFEVDEMTYPDENEEDSHEVSEKKKCGLCNII